MLNEITNASDQGVVDCVIRVCPPPLCYQQTWGADNIHVSCDVSQVVCDIELVFHVAAARSWRKDIFLKTLRVMTIPVMP